MRNQANVHGDGNLVDQSERDIVKVNGDHANVRFKTRDVYIDQRRTEIRQEAANTGRQGGQGPLAASVAVALLAAWLYVKHFDAVIQHLKDGILVSAAPAALTLLLMVLRSTSKDDEVPIVTPQDLALGLFGPVVAAGLVWLTQTTASMLPEDIIAAAQGRGLAQFWLYLNEGQRTLLGENVLAIAGIAFAMCFNFLMCIHTLADELIARTNVSVVVRFFGLTYKYRPQRMLVYQFFLVVTALLAISGKGQDLFHQWQEFVGSALSS